MALLAAIPVAAQQGEAIKEAEAVKLAFPGCEVTRVELALTKAQQAKAIKRARVAAVAGKIVRYVAKKKGVVQGLAYVDSRRVRSQAQTLLVILDAAATVRRIEVLAWKEPRRYRPRPAFWAQFQGKKLDNTLRLRRGIRPVTGATLSARAAVDAVRTVLAVHEVIGVKKASGSL